MKARAILASATLSLVVMAAALPATAGADTNRTCDGIDRPPAVGFYCYTRVSSSPSSKSTAITGYLNGGQLGTVAAPMVFVTWRKGGRP